MISDPIQVEIFKNIFSTVAEEMGLVLRRSAYSPNIKERRDFSCAIFDKQGNMIAQAAHIPVHLGSMPLSVAAAVDRFGDLGAGDVVVLNDPYRGGTHLPDITMVSPVFSGEGVLCAYTASRAHHADVGGAHPGSMAVANEIYQEGLVIPPVRLVRSGVMDQDLLDLILANVRTPEERKGDLFAQIAANKRGAERMVEIIARYGIDLVEDNMGALLAYSERMTRSLMKGLPDGEYSFSDCLDNNGVEDRPVGISVTIKIEGDQAVFDFSASAGQQNGSLNAVFAITLSAVFYSILCMLEPGVPANAGCLVPVRVIAPVGSVVNCSMPAAVAGGNVETSQRIVDVLLGAWSQILPGRVPAASQGTMNNVTIGGWDPERGAQFAYYETIAGGNGARPESDGPSGVHSHMTNTLNTPVEALEYAYPLRVLRYELRQGSGGAGRFSGGDGIRRDIQALVPCQVNLLTERRSTVPYALAGAEPGSPGENWIIRDGRKIKIAGKGTFELEPGDVLSILTPGGGGFGKSE